MRGPGVARLFEPGADLVDEGGHHHWCTVPFAQQDRQSVRVQAILRKTAARVGLSLADTDLSEELGAFECGSFPLSGSRCWLSRLVWALASLLRPAGPADKTLGDYKKAEDL